MLTTNQKGLIAETAVIAACMQLDIGVCRPLDHERYDLILDLRPRLLRIQCKWACHDGKVVVARLYSNRRGPEGMITRRYTLDEIDGFAVYCQELGQAYFLPGEDCVRRTVLLRLQPTRNNQAAGIRWAKDYDFAARLRSLQGP